MPGIVYLLTSDKIGNQDPELGTIAMNTLLNKLNEAKKKPTHIIFVERGVHLVLPESKALNDLKMLETQGVELLVCETCLDFYSLKDQIGVGKLVKMPSIIEMIHEADKVITL